MKSLVALVILDGWGLAPPGPGNAVELAETPVFDSLWERYPHTTLRASGEAVGLPPGQMGNSEVGHLTIGAGRVLLQDLMRVNRAIQDGSFFANEALVSAFRRARERGGDVHLLGLVSYGGVHSHIEHLRALLALAERADMARADVDPRLHRRTRRVPDVRRERPRRAPARADRDRVRSLLRHGPRQPLGSDRSRVRRDLSRRGRQRRRSGRGRATELQAGVTDEFVEPVVIEGRPRLGSRTRRGDLLQLPARPRAPALAAPSRGRGRPDDDDALSREHGLSRSRSRSKRCGTRSRRRSRGTAQRQLHAAETEKYAHVTYFLNGGEE